MIAKISKKLLVGLEPAGKPFEVSDTDTKGLLLRVQPSGTMTFYFRFRLPGGRKGGQTRVKIGPLAMKENDVGVSLKQARDKAKELFGQLMSGLDPGEQKRRAKTDTLRDFVDGPYGEWARAHRKTGHEKIVRIKGSFAKILNKPLAEITAWDIDQWRSKRSKEIKGGKTRAVGTLNRDLAYLKAALSKAVEWRLIHENPLRTVKMQREDRTPRERYLSDEEEMRLIAALDAREERFFQKRDAVIEWCRHEGINPPANLRDAKFYDYLKPFVLMALNTGMRFGEITSLE